MIDSDTFATGHPKFIADARRGRVQIAPDALVGLADQRDALALWAWLIANHGFQPAEPFPVGLHLALGNGWEAEVTEAALSVLCERGYVYQSADQTAAVLAL